MTIRVEVVPTHQTPEALHQPIADAFRQIFPHVNDQARDENGVLWGDGMYRVLAYEGDVWGALAELTVRDILVGGQTVRVGGVGGVLTLPHVRRHGLGKAVMHAALRYICEELKADAGMLYCTQKNIPFYAVLGWRVLTAPITFQQDGQAFLFKPSTSADTAMIYPCGGFIFPEGPIDVQGPLW